MRLVSKTAFLLLVSVLTTLGTASFAQLTVFNVPSSEITDARKINVQQQFEIQDIIESSTTVTYGFGKNWEGGLNLINVDYNLSTRHFEKNDTSLAVPFSPLLLATAQKSFELTDVLAVGLGAMAGTNLSGHRKRFVYYAYSNLVAMAGAEKQYHFSAGPYLSRHEYLGDGPVYGVQAAVDAGIVHEKFHLLADWISGKHQKGRLTVGFEVFITQYLPLALAWQRSNADGSNAAVVQLTFLAK